MQFPSLYIVLGEKTRGSIECLKWLCVVSALCASNFHISAWLWFDMMFEAARGSNYFVDCITSPTAKNTTLHKCVYVYVFECFREILNDMCVREAKTLDVTSFFFSLSRLLSFVVAVGASMLITWQILFIFHVVNISASTKYVYLMFGCLRLYFTDVVSSFSYFPCVCYVWCLLFVIHFQWKVFFPCESLQKVYGKKSRSVERTWRYFAVEKCSFTPLKRETFDDDKKTNCKPKHWIHKQQHAYSC